MRKRRRMEKKLNPTAEPFKPATKSPAKKAKVAKEKGKMDILLGVWLLRWTEKNLWRMLRVGLVWAIQRFSVFLFFFPFFRLMLGEKTLRCCG